MSKPGKNNSKSKQKEAGKKVSPKDFNLDKDSVEFQRITRNMPICISFKDYLQDQEHSFDNIQDIDMLKKIIKRLRDISTMTIHDAMSHSGPLTIYGDFPVKSKLNHPKHVTNDANWASIHVMGKECLGGHLFGNIFYLVFTDLDHDLWPTEKKHT